MMSAVPKEARQMGKKHSALREPTQCTVIIILEHSVMNWSALLHDMKHSARNHREHILLKHSHLAEEHKNTITDNHA